MVWNGCCSFFVYQIVDCMTFHFTRDCLISESLTFLAAAGAASAHQWPRTAPARLPQALPVLQPARCLGRTLGAGPWAPGPAADTAAAAGSAELVQLTH